MLLENAHGGELRKYGSLWYSYNTVKVKVMVRVRFKARVQVLTMVYCTTSSYFRKQRGGHLLKKVKVKKVTSLPLPDAVRHDKGYVTLEEIFRHEHS
jgi:hypothetical protein